MDYVVSIGPTKFVAGLVPILFLGGYAKPAQVYQKHHSILTEETKRPVCVFSMPAGPVSVPEDFLPGQPQVFRERVYATKEFVTEHMITDFDVIGYSEGALIALFLAFTVSRVRNLYLFHAPGFEKPSGTLKIIVRATRNALSKFKYRHEEEARKKEIKNLSKQWAQDRIQEIGLWSMITESMLPGKANLMPLLKVAAEAKERKISFLFGDSDFMVPAQKIPRGSFGLDKFATVKTWNGTHDDVELFPEACLKAVPGLL